MSSLPLTPSELGGAPVAPSRLVVGVADQLVTADANARLVTYALGSCLGVVVHDPVARVGGMLHVMLPESSIDADKAAANPAMFVDTGVPRLFHEAYRLGATKSRLVVKVAGGAAVQGRSDMFEIGKRNMIALRRILWQNGVMIARHDVGGALSRTMTLDVATGEVTLRVDGTLQAL
jgi:Chemotaxis protein; stimulates methylation of MCP proteins